MHLFAQEMHQLILSSGNFIHGGGHFSDFTLGTNFVKENRKNTRELFHLLIVRCNVRIENFGDFALKQIRVADKNTAKPKAHDQRTQQLFHS